MCWNLACQHLQLQDKCVNLFINFRVSRLCSCVWKGWHQSQSSGLPGRVAMSYPLGCHPDRPGLQAFRFGWLAFLLIKSEKGLETDGVHVLHNPWFKFVSFLQFSSWIKERWLEKLYSSAERKQTIHQHLFNHLCWVLSQRMLYSIIINHLVGRWFIITVPQMKKGRVSELCT